MKNEEKAKMSWKWAIKHAEKLGLQYEKAHSIWQVEKLDSQEEDFDRKRIESAIQIFRGMGAKLDLDAIENELKKRKYVES